MNKLVYLPELDSVRNTDEEIIRGQKALFEEIVVNGNKVVLSFNQIADSKAFLSAVKSDKQYEFIIGLFKQGYLKLSNYKNISTASQYIQNALEKNLSNQETGNVFIFSELPIRKDEKELTKLMLDALKYSRPSLIEQYKTDNDADKERIEYLIRYTDMLLTLSRENLANNPAKQGEMKNFMYFIDAISNMAIYEDNSDNANVWSLFYNSIKVLKEIAGIIMQENVVREQEGRVLISINDRSNWIYTLNSIDITNMPDEEKYAVILAEAIVNIAYNYAIEDSITNVSKHYNDDDIEHFYKDFKKRLEIYWAEYKEGIHELHRVDVEDVNDFIKNDNIELPCWETAVRVTSEKKKTNKKKPSEAERSNYDINKTPLYENNHTKEKKKWKIKLKLVISKKIIIALFYILLFCLMDTLSGGMENVVANIFNFFGLQFNGISTFIVNIIVYTILLGAITSLITAFINIPDILESLKDILLSMRDIKNVKNADTGVSFILDDDKHKKS